MRSPPSAAAALLLAALAALPYRGTEADVTSTLLNADSERKLNYSTLNKTYQRLHTAYFDLHSQRSPYATSKFEKDIPKYENSRSRPNVTSTFENRTPFKVTAKSKYSENALNATSKFKNCGNPLRATSKLENSINKIRGDRSGLKFPKDGGLSRGIRVNNARVEKSGGGDFSKVSPERNHKRRKRTEGGARGVAEANSQAANPPREAITRTIPPLVAEFSNIQVRHPKTTSTEASEPSNVKVKPVGRNFVAEEHPEIEIRSKKSAEVGSSLELTKSTSKTETHIVQTPRVLPLHSNIIAVETSSETLAMTAAALSGNSLRPQIAITESSTARGAVMTSSTNVTKTQQRRRPGESSGAPLLNYIFDTYSSTHQHRNDRSGGGGGGMTAAEPAVEALVGSATHLDCKVDALHDKLVSWVRRKSDGDAMELLTTGTQKYTADDRYSARFMAPDTWRLEIRDVRATDAALYDCQLSAHPPRTARVALHVPAVSVVIVDGAGASVSEQVCEQGSTVTLRCVVRGLRMEGGRALHWYRLDTLLNDDTTRGGISVRTELGASGAESVLRVARVTPADAGRYTCLVQAAPRAALLAPAQVALHVIQGESLAELHAGRGRTLRPTNVLMFIFICTLLRLY